MPFLIVVAQEAMARRVWRRILQFVASVQFGMTMGTAWLENEAGITFG
jgi:hypothetical protein